MAKHVTARAHWWASIGGGLSVPSFVTHSWEADSLALSDGDPVTTWTDSIAGKTLSQAITANKPTWRAGGGTPYIEFDGTDDQLDIDDTTVLDNIIKTAAYSMFAVISWDDYGTNTLALPLGNTTSSGARGHSLWFDQRTTVGVGLNMAHNSVLSLQQTRGAITEIGDTADHAYALIGNGSGVTGEVWVDGSEISYTLQTALSASPGDVMPAWQIGRGSGPAFPHDGKIRALYYADNHSATPAEIAEITTYIQTKWGTP